MVSILGFIGTPHVMQHVRYLGDGGDGATYGPAIECRGRWERHQRQLQLADGRVVTTQGIIKLPAPTDPAVGDHITYDDIQYEVVEVQSPAWFDGTVMHHEVKVA